MDIFKQAKSTAQPSSAKVKKKVLVPVALGSKITELIATRNQISELETKEEQLIGDIKPVAKEKFLELYKKGKIRPESFIIQSESGKLLVIVQDKYTLVTDGKEAALKELKLEDVIEETDEFTFNKELLQKYGKKISAAFAKLDIPDEDKEKLVECKSTKVIRKGTIERLGSFKNIDTVFAVIDPVVQLKNQR